MLYQSKRQKFTLKQRHIIGTTGLRNKLKNKIDKKNAAKYWNEKRKNGAENRQLVFLLQLYEKCSVI